MRKRLLEILMCPECKSDLEVEIEETVVENGEEKIIKGRLKCKNCGAEFPIEDGIPNMLSPELRA